MSKTNGQGARRKVVWGPKGRALALAALIALTGGAVSATAQRPPSTPPDVPPLRTVPEVIAPASALAQEGFVRVDRSPQQEQLPAAPLVMGAYAVAWVAILFYVWSIWQRLNRVERELADVSRRVESGARR